MKSAVRPIVNALRLQRGFAAQAQVTVAKQLSLPKQDTQISRLPNGGIVASVENYSPISKVAIVFRAGSRAEDVDNVGVTHCLRNAANMSTVNKSRFLITRSMEQIGGNLTCLTGRDHVIYQMEVLRGGLVDGFANLSSVATNNEFRFWELNQNVDRTNIDLAVLNDTPEALLSDVLHKAAYRKGLGNAIYMPEYTVGKHSPPMLQDFVNANYTGENMAVVGMGVDHAELFKIAKELVVNKLSAPPAAPSVYHVGEIRVDTGNPLVHVAVVSEGLGLGSSDLLALGVLQHIMGAGSNIKYSYSATASRVYKAAEVGITGPFAASCINLNYADSGLFGFHAIAGKNEIGPVVQSLLQQFRDNGKDTLTDEDVTRGKAQLRSALHMASESQSNMLAEMATQVMLSGQVLGPKDLDATIEKITLADVQAIAKRVCGGKATMAAVGDLGNTPYLDQIKV